MSEGLWVSQKTFAMDECRRHVLNRASAVPCEHPDREMAIAGPCFVCQLLASRTYDNWVDEALSTAPDPAPSLPLALFETYVLHIR